MEIILQYMNVNKFLIHTTVFKRDMEMYGLATDIAILTPLTETSSYQNV